jgi:sugar/nucleoside kinase (ribokinase family)
MNDIDVLVVGRNCVDHIAAVKRYPEENHKAPLHFRITDGGGQGGTYACCIAKLGGRPAFICRLGDDDEGMFCLKRLEDFGVNTEFVQVVEGGKTPTSYIFVTLSSGRRTIIYEPNLLPRLDIGDLLPALACRPKILLLDPGITYLTKALASHLDSDITMVYDCERWREGIREMMAAADFFIPSAVFLDDPALGFEGLSFSDRLSRLKSMIGGELVVTRGAQGVWYFSGRGRYHVAAPTIAVKDTTGAGDNFHAAFALALSRGLDIHEAVKFSVAVASLSCRGYGGRAGIPELSEAREMAGTLASTRLG